MPLPLIIGAAAAVAIGAKSAKELISNKKTSKRVASTASKILRDKRTSSASKSVAGSALSQTPSKKK